MGKAETRRAIANAMELLGKISGTSHLPTQSVRDSVITMVGAGDLETLLSEHPDLTKLVSGLFDWAPGTDTRTTDGVVKAAEELLRAEDRLGRSLYPQAVSMLSYAAAAAPLMDPSDLERLIAVAYDTTQIYAPVRYVATLAVPLKKMIGFYPKEVRTQLIFSLWETAHDGEWWQRLRLSNRRYPYSYEDTVGDVFIGDQYVSVAAASHQQLVEELISGDPCYTQYTGARLALIDELADTDRSAIVAKIKEPRAHTQRVLASHLVDIPLMKRPESPMLAMVQILEEQLKEVTENHAPAAVQPGFPQRWADLYPEGSLEPYPYQPEIWALNGTQLSGVEGSEIWVVANASGFSKLGTQMGHVVMSNQGLLETGERIVLWVRAEDGTAAVILEHKSARYQLHKVVGRVIAGVEHTPDGVEASAKKLVRALNKK